MRVLNAIIQLRRDSETNFEKIKDSFIPANGEVVLVDTKDGLRPKVGNGNLPYSKLKFIDESYRDTIVNGYYENGIFYTDVNKTDILDGQKNKLYIDNAHSKIYYYDGDFYVNIQQSLTTATDTVSGTVKLYDDLGNNTDGTITQKRLTQEFNTRYKTRVKQEEEMLIFSL